MRRGPPGHRRLGSASSSPTRASASSALANEMAVMNRPAAGREHGPASASSLHSTQMPAVSKMAASTKDRPLHMPDTESSISNMRNLQSGSSLSNAAEERDQSGTLSARTTTGMRDGPTTGIRDVPSTATSLGDSQRHATPGTQASPDSRDRGAGASTFLAQGYAHRKQVRGIGHIA